MNFKSLAAAIWSKAFGWSNRPVTTRRAQTRLDLEVLEDRLTPSVTITDYSQGITPTGSLRGLALGADGNIWGAEENTGYIDVVTTNGDVTQYTNVPAGQPNRIIAGPSNTLWVTEPYTNEILRITTSGQTDIFSAGTSLNGIANSPTSVAFGPDGKIWFTSAKSSTIVQMDPNTGEILNQYVTPVAAVSGICGLVVGSDGALWWCAQAADLIGRITTSGEITTFTSNDNAPSSRMVAGADGDIYFTQPSDGEFGRINPLDGDITEFAISGIAAGTGPFGIIQDSRDDIWWTGTNMVGETTISGLTSTSLEFTQNASGQLNTMAIDSLGRLCFAGEQYGYLGVITLASPTFTTTSLANWDLNAAGYNQSIGTAGVTGAATFSLQSGNELPRGLNLNSSGQITGTPTVAGAFTFNVIVTDSLSESATQTYTIDVNQPPSITTSSLENWTKGASGYSQTISIANGTGPFTFTIQSGDSLPSGLSLNSATGAITGAPTATGAYAFHVVATDSVGSSSSQAYTVTIAGPMSISGDSFSATAGESFSGEVAVGSESSLLTEARNLTATISWGDGETSSGTVDSQSNGLFPIVGAHNYAAPGSYAVTVTLQDQTNPASYASETTEVTVEASPHHSQYAAAAYEYAYDAYVYAYDAAAIGAGSDSTYAYAYDSYYYAYFAYYYDAIGAQTLSEQYAYYAYYDGYIASSLAYSDYVTSGGASSYSYDAYYFGYFDYVYSYCHFNLVSFAIRPQSSY